MNRSRRTRFMQTIREALGHRGVHPRRAPAELFPTAPSDASLRRLARARGRTPADRRELIEALRRAARPIKLDVVLVANAEAAAAAVARQVVAARTEWGGPKQVCAWNHPLIDSLALGSVLGQHGIPVVSRASFAPPDTGRISGDQRAALRNAVAASFAGVTAADFCVADTATLVLRTRPGRPRSMSLVPSIHIAVITADQIVADFKELYALLRWGEPDGKPDLTPCMTFVSGPSKTADIEATLVHGAHGPRAVTLVVIETHQA
ncbi:MAG TPA: lactate utilization protein [Desulfosarcina sp.]|nr:lactate utilization protein [Desulfosarcina sp.]